MTGGDGVPAAAMMMMTAPASATVRYNDWRQIGLPAPDTFTPTLPVSVIVPAYNPSAAMLARTLATLEGQTYPRDLFEVVLVDDGSDPPLARHPATPLDVTVVRQQHQGFGAGRARNTGARAAAHDVLLFLDSDMLVEADWIAAHARWHHAVSDALTIGLRAHVAVDGLGADTIRRRTGRLEALLSDRPVDWSGVRWVERHLARTRDLTSRADDLFRVVIGSNMGIRKDFYWLVGGSDESFVRWGLEDTELAWRAYVRGGLLALVREAFAWHQGGWEEGRAEKDRSLEAQLVKAAHLIAHREFRGALPGRIFAVPQYVVTVDADRLPACRVIRTVEAILADRVHDLVVRIEAPPSPGPTTGEDERLALLQDAFGPDPRVRVDPARGALDEFPASAFHVTLPVAAMFARNLVHRLRAGLGDAVTAACTLPGGDRVSIVRAWALHRARRASGRPADFGEARTLSAAALRITTTGEADRAGMAAGRPARWRRWLDMKPDIRGMGEALAFFAETTGRVWWQAVTALRFALQRRRREEGGR